MDTLTIAFEDRNLISVIKELVNSMNGVSIVQPVPFVEQSKSRPEHKKLEYSISPVIKAMETGYSLSDDISDNYKQEISDYRAKKYL